MSYQGEILYGRLTADAMVTEEQWIGWEQPERVTRFPLAVGLDYRVPITDDTVFLERPWVGRITRGWGVELAPQLTTGRIVCVVCDLGSEVAPREDGGVESHTLVAIHRLAFADDPAAVERLLVNDGQPMWPDAPFVRDWR